MSTLKAGTNSNLTAITLSEDTRGEVVIDKSSALTRLNYFDGKFLRAPDLQLEQAALLNQIRLSNQAGGAGIVHGYNCTAGDGDSLLIGGGFALDFSGRALLLSDDITVSIPELIEKSRSDLPALAPSVQATSSASIAAQKSDLDSSNGSNGKADFDDCVIHTQSTVLDATDNNDLYLITINHVEAYCGQEDVFGKLCSEACSTSSSHSYIIEGIEIRAVPLNLSVLLKQSSAVSLSQNHLRSRVVSAFFAQERSRITSHISANGLSSLAWCLGAEAASGSVIPIALLGRNGTTTLFLDAWAARRERMESPPRHYWAGRMAMRPWNVFLAQVLQFQCQLRGCLTSSDPNSPCKTLKEFDPCADTREVAREAATGMRYLLDSMSKTATRLAEFEGNGLAQRQFADFDGGMTRLESYYQRLVDSSRIVVPDRLLINCGIVELPSAGYLPVNVSSTISVNEQVERLLGEGLDLRFCVVRPDFVAHALEEAQHMDRICLLTGIDNPEKRARVDILVPNGEIEQLQAVVEGTGYQANISVQSGVFALGWPRDIKRAAQGRLSTPDLPSLTGAARGEQLDTGGYGFYLAAQSGQKPAFVNTSRRASDIRINTNTTAAAAKTADLSISTLVPNASLWLDLKVERDPFDLNVGEVTDVRARMTMIVSRRVGDQPSLIIQERNISGQLHIQKSAAQKTDTKFTARLIAQGIWNENIVAGSNSDDRSEVVKLDETVIVSRAGLTGLPPTISIAIINPSFYAKLKNVQLVFERVWISPTESRVRSLLRYQTSGKHFSNNDFSNRINFSKREELQSKEVEFSRLKFAKDVLLSEGFLVEDQSVMQPGNQYHSLSLTALNQIGKATDDKSFSDQAGSLLFPPPQTAPSELRILAHESWVLFHRRRDKVCAAAVAAEVLVKPRSYRVFHIHLPSEVEIDTLISALETNGSAVIERLDAKPVTIVEYAPALATIATAHGDVRADWQAAVQVDANVHIGLIASEGDVINDGEELADNRLQSLTGLLSTVSEAADNLALLSTSEVPSNLAAGEVDGVIIYFTRAVATVCHSVYRILTHSTEAILGRLDVYLQGSSGESLPSFVQKLGAQALSVNPRFVGDGDAFFGANEARQLASSWDLVDDGPISSVVALASDETEAEQLITRQQASKIAQTVGSKILAESIIYRTGTAGILKPCTKASLLIAEIECNDIYFFTPRRGQQDVPLLPKLINFISEEGFTTEVLKDSDNVDAGGVSVFKHLSAVNFYHNSGLFEASSRQQFLDKWRSELNGTPPSEFNGFYIAIARSGSDPLETSANLAVVKAQTEKLQETMGINSSGVSAVTNNVSVDFPVSCRAFTLVVMPSVLDFSVGVFNTVAVAVGASASTEPSLTQDLARSVAFDDNNVVIRDEKFNTVLARIAANESEIKTLELVSVDTATDAAAETRAKSLLAVLKEEGVANNNAKLVVRAADSMERTEIIRSGFLLNHGMVLK